MDLTWLKSIAPTVASALGGPLAGVAVTALGAAFGWTDITKDKVVDALQSGNLTGDQIVAIKQLEADLKKQEKELGFKFAELDMRDRDSARQREVSTKDITNRVLAYVVVTGFLATIATVLGGFAVVDGALAGTLVGYISAKCEQVLSYYFGSTQGSARKTELLAQSAEAANGK